MVWDFNSNRNIRFIVAKGPKSMNFIDKIIIAYIPIFRIVISSNYAIIWLFSVVIVCEIFCNILEIEPIWIF